MTLTLGEGGIGGSFLSSAGTNASLPAVGRNRRRLRPFHTQDIPLCVCVCFMCVCVCVFYVCVCVFYVCVCVLCVCVFHVCVCVCVCVCLTCVWLLVCVL